MKNPPCDEAKAQHRLIRVLDDGHNWKKILI
jgi:hypothetical protein